MVACFLGGILSENSPWSTAGSSNIGWSSMSPNGQFLDNQPESQSVGSAGHSPNSRMSNQPGNSQNSFDIPEFVPGQPWQGSTSNKIEDDPNITPGIVARSLSVTASSMSAG